MMVMFRRRKDEPIHISIKGKTIDGLPELNVKLENAEWSVVEWGDSAELEKNRKEAEFKNSPIRKAILAIAENNQMWKGRCSTLINDAIGYEVAITEGAREVGGFLHRHQGRFLEADGIKIEIIDNGSASKIYKIQKSTIHTIHENEDPPFIDMEKADKQGLYETPFL